MLVSLRIGLWPHHSWPCFARHSDINRAPALQTTCRRLEVTGDVMGSEIFKKNFFKARPI